jgi:hypothetical protein
VAGSLELDELVEHFTLLPDDLALLRNKTGATRLGFAVMAKFLPWKGRFPRGRAELPDEVVEFVARQVKVAAADIGLYDFAGRTIKGHRRELREALGWRPCGVPDAEKLTEWLAEYVCPKERRPDHVRGELLVRCRAERIEPPAPARIDAIVRSALYQAEQVLIVRVHGRCDAGAIERVLAMVDRGAPVAEANGDEHLDREAVEDEAGDVLGQITEARPFR